MASPFKTHETMDLARLMQEEDTYEGRESEKERDNLNRDLDASTFNNLVVTKDSSTELIPSQPMEKPTFMADLNAGRGTGMLDDDGKPVVGKVFSRVIQISGTDSKPKQLKARRSRKEDCSSSASCSQKESREKSSARPQSSGTNNSGAVTTVFQTVCPSCNRQFSGDALTHHVSYCKGKES